MLDQYREPITKNMPSKHIEISAATESLLSGFITQNPVKM